MFISETQLIKQENAKKIKKRGKIIFFFAKFLVAGFTEKKK